MFKIAIRPKDSPTNAPKQHFNFQVPPASGLGAWWFRFAHTKLKPGQRNALEGLTANTDYQLVIERRTAWPPTAKAWAVILVYDVRKSDKGRLIHWGFLFRKKQPLI